VDKPAIAHTRVGQEARPRDLRPPDNQPEHPMLPFTRSAEPDQLGTQQRTGPATSAHSTPGWPPKRALRTAAMSDANGQDALAATSPPTIVTDYARRAAGPASLWGLGVARRRQHCAAPRT